MTIRSKILKFWWFHYCGNLSFHLEVQSEINQTKGETSRKAKLCKIVSLQKNLSIWPWPSEVFSESYYNHHLQFLKISFSKSCFWRNRLSSSMRNWTLSLVGQRAVFHAWVTRELISNSKETLCNGCWLYTSEK